VCISTTCLCASLCLASGVKYVNWTGLRDVFDEWGEEEDSHIDFEWDGKTD